MKTLDEALSVIESPGGKDLPRLKDEAARFMPLYTEIAENKRVVSLCVASIQVEMARAKVLDSGLDDVLFMTWLSGFTSGVKIGMEMERQEPAGLSDQHGGKGEV